jgi:hypothetical protein
MKSSAISAMPSGWRAAEPLKIHILHLAARSDLADCSPSTQEMASEMLDFAAAVGSDHRRNRRVEHQLGAVIKRLEPLKGQSV